MRTYALFFLFALISATPALADDADTTTDAETPASTDTSTLSDRIDEAKKLLSKASIGTSRIGGENAVLAVWNAEDAKGIRLVTVRGGISRTQGFSVTLVRKNGVNSQYKVIKPEGYKVLALRTNVKNRTGGKARSRTAIYVPYSPEIHTPEIEEKGKAYLLELVDRSADTLDANDVRSIFDGELRVTETVPERVLLTLLVIEHITPSEFDSLGTEATVGKVLATIGLNGEDSYDFAVSSAAAGGLAQFIAETYKLTRSRYPKAKLVSSFVDGMRDHHNAVKAQYCLADWSISRLPLEARLTLTDGTHEEDLGAYIAAAYNGGEERASPAYVADPVDWEKEGKGLHKQTVTYVREFRAVYRYLFPSGNETPDH